MFTDVDGFALCARRAAFASWVAVAAAGALGGGAFFFFASDPGGGGGGGARPFSFLSFLMMPVTSR